MSSPSPAVPDPEHRPVFRPWMFVPVLFILQSLPSSFIREVATLFFKDLGMANASIALWVSLLGLPYILQLFWAPLVDLNFSRRAWLLTAQMTVLLALVGVSIALQFPVFFPLILLVLFILAIASATHDVALGGYYLMATTRQQQAAFVGVQTTFYRVGRLMCTGLFVMLAGFLQKQGLSIPASWALVMLAFAAFYGGGWLYLKGFLPRLDSDRPSAVVTREENHGNILRTVWMLLAGLCLYGILSSGIRLAGHGLWLFLNLKPASGDILPLWRLAPETLKSSLWILPLSLLAAIPVSLQIRRSIRGTVMGDSFASFIDQPRIGAILVFIALYRLGESMVSIITPLFLRDAPAEGGLGLSVAEIGFINGVTGIVAISLGGIAGGFVISRFGLRRVFWPLALCMHLPNLLYAWAAWSPPSTAGVYAIVAVDQFGYGFGFSAYIVYGMYVAQRGHFLTTHTAIIGAIAGLSAVFAGILAGIVQASFGYFWFFITVMICTIPGMLSLLFIPLPDDSRKLNES